MVVPVYDEAPNLPRILPGIGDVLRRSRCAHEILVIDDASPDGSAGASRLEASVVLRDQEGGNIMRRTVIFVALGGALVLGWTFVRAPGSSAQRDLPPDPELSEALPSIACYTITMPSDGSYQVDLSLVDDIGDGRPPIETLIGQDGGAIHPCFRNLTIHIESSVSATHPTDMTCSGATYVDPVKDGTPGPGGGGRSFATRKGIGPPSDPCGALGASEVILPVSCADANNDGQVSIKDVNFLGAFLFRGGTAPKTVSTEYLTTRQTTCWDDGLDPNNMDGTALMPCPVPPELFSGQDAFYMKGVLRSYERGVWLDPTVSFVTSAAYYRITMPSEG